MDTRQQTKVTDQNRSAYFQTVYAHQTLTKDQLVNLDVLSESTIMLIDCCSWHYKKLFSNKNIIGLETIKTVKDFGLDRTHFDKLIDNQFDDSIGWPSVSETNCALIFDRSPILRYTSVEKLSSILNTTASKYDPNTIVLELPLMFIDQPCLVDKFYTLSLLTINNYIVTEFNYNTNAMHLSVKFSRKIKLV